MLIRKLEEQDWPIYKTIRLEALKLHPDVFGTPYEEALGYSDDQWRDILSDKDQSFFGLFDEEEIVGTSGIFLFDAEKRTGLLIGGYIRASHRGKNYSRLLYEARIEWARKSGLFDTLIVSHRQGNEASRRANQAFGFRHMGDVEYQFGDGTKDVNQQYELRLR